MRYVLLVPLIAALAWTGYALADTFPSHSIRLVVPFPAGGGVDTIARVLQPSLQKSLGQPVIVDNRPGAASILGTEIVSRAAPDGYTLLFALNPHVVNSSLYRKLPYDPLNDFAAISLIATTPNVLVVNPAVNAKTVKELIDLAKSQPGVLNYASAGVGSPFHLAGALFNVMADVNITHIPYKGGPQATVDLLAGQVQIMFGNLFNVLPYIQNGQLRAIAVTSPRRLSVLPNVPTITEAGLPGYVFESWFGLLAPRSTPPEIIERLHTAVLQAISSPEIKKQLAAQGSETVGSSPKEFSDFLITETTKWARVAKQSGLQPE